MNVASRWKITFNPYGANPIIMLDAGQLIESEIPWQLDRPVEIVNLVDGAAPFIRPLGNALYTINFTAIQPTASDFTARSDLMAWMDTWPLQGKAPLKIQISTNNGGVYGVPHWLFASCYVTSYAPVRDVENGKDRIKKTFSIVASGITRVTS